jgi:hypothetical protein
MSDRTTTRRSGKNSALHASPARSFLMGAAMRKGRKIHEMAYRRVVAAFSGRGASAREWRETMHVLEKGGHAIRKAWDSLTDADEDKRQNDDQ